MPRQARRLAGGPGDGGTALTHPIVEREAWLAARKKHLEDEKAFTKARDALSARRRALPWLRLDKAYRFRTPEGETTLPELFGRHSQLIAVHFMFGPDWDEGCKSCSMMADGYDGLGPHLAARDTAFVIVSNTSIEKIERYRARMGWRFRRVSSLGSDSNRDFNVTFTPEELQAGEAFHNYRKGTFPSTEAPGISVFHKPDADGRAHLLNLRPGGRSRHGHLPFARPDAEGARRGRSRLHYDLGTPARSVWSDQR
jgi:predicted dithiol-disulfide oxidoreductase (DUF899 family)